MVPLLFITLLLCLVSSASAQQIGQRTYAASAVGNDVGVGNLGSGIGFHLLTWNTLGTVTGCTTVLQQSVDGASWSTLIAGQTCTANGQSTVTNVVANYIRIQVTAFTGTGQVIVHWDGFITDPAGGGGGGTFTGTVAQGQVVVGTGADVLGGVANGSAGYALVTNGGNPAIISWSNPANFMVYPSGGIAVSSGSGWTTSYTAQGSDTALLSSGVISGTSVALCTDANGGATTSSCPAGGISYPPAGIPNSTGTGWGTSLAPQGTGTKVLTSSTISGTATPLCTDAGGSATTTGCPGPAGSINTGVQYQIGVYAADGTAISGGPTPPAVQGKYSCGYSPTTAAKVALTCPEVGLTTRAVTGTTSTDTILYSDNSQAVNYTGSVAVAITLPTAVTLNNASFYTIVDNNTSGSPSNVTITPTTWTINGAATLVIKQGQECRVSIDPTSATNWLGQCGASLVSGQVPISQVGTSGLSGTSPIAISAAGAISCSTCNTSSTTAGGDLTGTYPNPTIKTSVTLTTPVIGVATGTSLLLTGNLDGKVPVTVTTGSSDTVTEFLTGYWFNQEATAGTGVNYTLPTAAAGLQKCFANSYNGSNPDTGVLTITTSASGQFIIFTDGTISATGGNVTSGGAAADAACMVGVDSTHWQMFVQSGTWTKH